MRQLGGTVWIALIVTCALRNSLVRQSSLEGKPMPSGSATQAAAPFDLVTGAGDRGRRIRAIVGASSGNLVEWYDFYTYAFTSIYFAAAFFPSGDATSQLLATAGIFAVGFFMRPLGGWLFGWIADRHG